MTASSPMRPTCWQEKSRKTRTCTGGIGWRVVHPRDRRPLPSSGSQLPANRSSRYAGLPSLRFAATEPIDSEPVTRLLGRPIAYTTDGGDPFYAVDPTELVSTVWGPPP